MRSHLLDWGVERVALQPLGVDTAAFHPDRARGRAGAPASASPPMRACSSTPAASPPRSTSTCSPTRWRGSARRMCCWRSAPGRCRRPGERVRVVPFIADVAALAAILAGADAFVHAGDQETFGLSALEAMACGTPIVVRQAEGLAELADGACGLAVEHGTGAAFAEAIAALLARRPAGAAARRPGAGRGQRLGAGAARPARPLPAPARGPRRHRRRRRRGGRSKPRPCRRHDERRHDDHAEPLRERALRLRRPARRRALDPRGLHAHARRRRRGRRRAGDAARGAALPRRAVDARAGRLAGGAAPRAATSWRCTAGAIATSRRPRASSIGLRRRVYTRGEGEFWALSEREATRRIEAGIAWFREHGWPLAGFVAPAWLLGPGAWQALATQRFEYTATLRELVHLPGPQQRQEPERRLQHLERLAAAELAALERGGRPAGARQPAAAHRAASARRRFRRRCAAPGRRCWRGRCATGGR